jgi:nicotinamidase/pyrazinamidase
MEYGPNTALIVVDMQNDFGDPKGNLYVSGGEEVVAVANADILTALASGGTVAYTQDWHPPDTPHFAKDGGLWPVHCVRDTWGAALMPGLRVEGRVFRKGSNGEDGYSGFTMRDPLTGAESSTGLEEYLRERGITAVAVLGLATDYCVKATALDAAAKGFATTLLQAGIRAVNLEPSDGDRAVEEMRTAGVNIE